MTAVEEPDAAPPFNPCQLLSDPENTPAAPFDYNDYTTNIYPDLKTGCSTVGCHGAPSGNKLTVFATGNCPEIETFNSMVPLVDYKVNVANSSFLKNMDGTDPHVGGSYTEVESGAAGEGPHLPAEGFRQRHRR